MTWVAEIDEDACAAHGDCAEIAPEVFEIDDVARVIGTGPEALLMASAEACPSTAIRIVDTDSGQQLYP
jgi:ferredoxin